MRPCSWLSPRRRAAIDAAVLDRLQGLVGQREIALGRRRLDDEQGKSPVAVEVDAFDRQAGRAGGGDGADDIAAAKRNGTLNDHRCGFLSITRKRYRSRTKHRSKLSKNKKCKVFNRLDSAKFS